jgi:Na+/H+-dicarboxylate symporter/ABC-type amino acid transport substrate-binding protein
VSLSSRILAGLAAGIATGLFFGELAGFLRQPGDAFIQLLQMTVLPYVTVSLVTGFGRLDRREAALLARRAGGVLLLLWAVALAAALTMPLAFPAWETASFFSSSLVEEPTAFDLVSLYIPANPFFALANNVVPAVVLFSTALGVALIGVERKQALLDALDGLAAALTRVNDFVVNLTPYGVFAIAASAAGTLTFDEFERIQVYLLSYVAVASLLSLWILPGLVAALLPLRRAQVIRASRDALVTAFATGSVFLVLPILVERSRELLAAADPRGGGAAGSVDVVVPASFSFPNSAKILALSFVLFAGWFSGQEVSPLRYPTLVGSGVASLFGSVNAAVPFLLDLFQIPADMFQLFLATSVVNARFGSLLGAMHTFVLALLASGASAGLVRVSGPAIARWSISSLLAGAAVLGGARLGFELAPLRPYRTNEVLERMHLVADPVPAIVHREAPPAPPPEPGRSGLQRAIARGRLRACYYPDFLPCSYFNSDGELVGFDIELAHMLARELGLGLEFIPTQSSELAAQVGRGECDIVTASLVVNTLRASSAVTFARPHLDGTLAFVVKDHRRDDFASWEALQRLAHPRIGVVTRPSYYFDMLRDKLPRAEIEVTSPREFFESRGEELDALLFTAELGAAWTLLYPQYSVAVPKPGVVSVPQAWAAASGDLETAYFLSTWIELKRATGVLARLHDRWLLGRDAEPHRPRWSVLRDLLGWRDVGADTPLPEPRPLGGGA